MAIDFKALQAPFPPEDIEWREQRNGVKDGRPWAFVLAYITNRAIQNRLDEVVGPLNWKNEFHQGPGGGVVCGISIKDGDQWVTKYDGADNTDIESVKGGLSDAMKRAAVQWGIGRYLYRLEANFAKVSEQGSHRGVAYASDADRKARKNPVYFRWDPPELPAWALPKGEALSSAKPTCNDDVPYFDGTDEKQDPPRDVKAPTEEQAGTFDQDVVAGVTIENIKKKDGTTKGKGWTLYTITDSKGQKYTTFDSKDAQAAQDAYESKTLVDIHYKKNSRGMSIESIIPCKGEDSKVKNHGYPSGFIPEQVEGGITDEQWQGLKDFMARIGVNPSDFIKAQGVISPRQLKSESMPGYISWISAHAQKEED